MTGPVNFNLFSKILGTANLHDLDDTKDKNPPVQEAKEQQPAMQMNVGEDQEPELDLSNLDPNKKKQNFQ